MTWASHCFSVSSDEDDTFVIRWVRTMKKMVSKLITVLYKKLTGDALPVLTTVFKALLKQWKSLWSRKQISSFKNRSRIIWSIIKLAPMYEGSACKIATTTITALLYDCSWRAGGYTSGRFTLTLWKNIDEQPTVAWPRVIRTVFQPCTLQTRSNR